MGASPSPRVIADARRRYLKTLALDNGGTYEAGKRGSIDCASGRAADGLAWIARMDILHASNGETAGLPAFDIAGPHGPATYRAHGAALTLPQALDAYRAKGLARRYIWTDKRAYSHYQPLPDRLGLDAVPFDSLGAARAFSFADGNRGDIYEFADLKGDGQRCVRQIGSTSPEALDALNAWRIENGIAAPQPRTLGQLIVAGEVKV